MNKTVRWMLAALMLAGLGGCEGCSPHLLVTSFRVAQGEDGRLHLVASRVYETEGGPGPSSLLYRRDDDDGLLEVASGAPSYTDVRALVLDGSGRPIVHLTDVPGTNVLQLDGSVWKPVVAAAGSLIPDEDLAAFQEAGSDAWIWTGADGIVRLMMPGSPDPAPRMRVFEIEDGLLTAVRYAPMPPGVGSTSFVDTTGIPDPVALFREETGSNVFVAGRLICDAGGCGWEIDPALRLVPAGEAGDASLLTRAASGIPVLVVPGILPSGAAGLEIAWPGGNAWVETRPTVFTAAALTGEGLVVAVYRGHEDGMIDLFVFDAAFDSRRIEMDPGGRYITRGMQVLVEGEAGRETVSIFYGWRCAVRRQGVSLSSGEILSDIYDF